MVHADHRESGWQCRPRQPGLRWRDELIRVTNKGKTTAHGCHVTLTTLWYVERGVWKRLDGWQPVDLIWSGRPGVQKIDLSPAENAFCDLGHVASDYLQTNVYTSSRVLRRDGPRPEQLGQLVLCLATVFNAQPNALEEGHYVIEVAAYSDNAGTQPLTCDLWYSGAFALITDTHVDQPLARTVLQQRTRRPEEGTLHEDVSPI